MKRSIDCAQSQEEPSANVSHIETVEHEDTSLLTTGASNSHIPHPNKKPRPGRRYIVKGSKRRAEYWKDYELFLDDQDNVRAECVHCDSTFAADSARNGTKNLKSHHACCEKNPQNKGKGKQATIHLEPLDGEEGEVRVRSRVVNSDDLREALTYMIVLDELPFRFVEKPGFRHLMSLAVPNFQIPSRITIARDCFKFYLKEKEKLKEFLKKSCQRVSVTTDTWTSNQNINYMCLTAHFIDDDWKLQKRILNFCQIYSHKGHVIGSAIDDCLDAWGISEKLFTVTVDNASSNDVACEFLKAMGSQKGYINGGKNLHMRCIAHIINLIVWDGLKEYGKCIENVRSAIKWIKASSARNALFDELVEKSKVDCKLSLSLDVTTRWNSTYTMLNTALKYRLIFGKMKFPTEKWVPTASEWNKVEKLVVFLKEFYELTTRVSGSLFVTSNSLFFHISHAYNLLSKWSLNEDKDFEGMALKMKEKYDKYWGDIDKMNKMIYMGVILDPNLKFIGIQLTLQSMYGQVKGEKMATDVKKFAEELFKEYKLIYAPSNYQSDEGSLFISSTSSSSRGGSLDLMNSISEQVKMKMRGCDTGSTFLRTDFDRYLDEIMGDDEEKDLLTWWKLNEARFPVVARMARDILAIPVSTVASESAFSAGGRHLDQFRSSLTPKMVQALICGQDWIRAQLRKPKLDMEENLEELEKMEKDLKAVNIDDDLIFVTE